MNPCIVINCESSQQQLYRLIYYSKSSLHVSGDVFAHHQEYLSVFTVSGSVHPGCCRLVSRMSWNCCFLLLFMFMWLVVSCLSMHALLYQIAAIVLYSFRLVFLYKCIPLACLAFINMTFQLIRDTSRQQLGWILPDTVNTVKCSWWWAKISPETCRADLE